MSRLKEQYQNEIVDALIKKFGYKNIMEVPKLDKVVINMGVGEEMCIRDRDCICEVVQSGSGLYRSE